MSRFATTIKEEIERISRREINKTVLKLRKDQASLKKTAVEQKRRISLLEKELAKVRRNQDVLLRDSASASGPAGDEDEIAIYGRGVKSLRRRLGISQSDLAKLLGVNPNSVVLWEKKSGKIRFRKPGVKKALVDLKGCRKSEVSVRLGKKTSRRKKRPS